MDMTQSKVGQQWSTQENRQGPNRERTIRASGWLCVERRPRHSSSIIRRQRTTLDRRNRTTPQRKVTITELTLVSRCAHCGPEGMAAWESRMPESTCFFPLPAMGPAGPWHGGGAAVSLAG
eukprot:3602468-Amphidinium_carterae.1